VVAEACRFSGAGSLFIADVSGTGLHRLPMMQAYLEPRSSRGLPPPFATDDPAGLLTVAGWTSVELFAPWRLAATYRRPFGRIAPDPSMSDASMQSYFVLTRLGG
jgi:hypothetical protein